MKSKKIISIILIVITMLGFGTISNAALESKAGQTSWRATANDQFTNIRDMEKNGGTLGLNANIDTTTYLDSTGNGIDVHMALATEWGTVALLSISDYGNYYTTRSDSGTNVSASTGNKTGVFQMVDNNHEYVCGMFEGGSNSNTSKIYSSNLRYYNLYSSNNSLYHKGDGIYQNQGWYFKIPAYNPYRYGSFVGQERPIYFRSGGMFGVGTERGGDYFGGNDYAHARACIACGEGL